jgi:hypothetical protein
VWGARVAEGERVQVDTASGPSEVRSLAVAFQSMSQRLVELDEQRELRMCGGALEARQSAAGFTVTGRLPAA